MLPFFGLRTSVPSYACMCVSDTSQERSRVEHSLLMQQLRMAPEGHMDRAELDAVVKLFAVSLLLLCCLFLLFLVVVFASCFFAALF